MSNAIPDADTAVLQLQHAEGDAIDVKHDVRPALAFAAQSHLFRHRKIVLLRLLPIDEMNRLRHLPRLDLHRHAVAQQGVRRLIVAVWIAAVIVRLGAQLVQGHGDLRRVIA